jgi:hypothetical protein
LRVVWQLFIVAKAKLYPPFPDLVASFNLLLCILAFVFSHVSSQQRGVNLADTAKLPVRNEEGAVQVLEVSEFCAWSPLMLTFL